MIILLSGVFASCSNQDRDFDDFDYTTVYFPYQTPIRVLDLGNDLYDNDADNNHQCTIMATTGGVYENNKNITIDIEVDNSLVDNLYYSSDSTKIKAMPSDYYTLASDKITIPKGKLMGGVQVQLTDKFFEDTSSVSTTYVIPLIMTSKMNADSILQGKTDLENANPAVVSDWEKTPKNFTLYAIKYINKYTGHMLRRGIDNIIGKNGANELDTTIINHENYTENDEVVQTFSKSLTTTTLALNAIDKQGEAYPFTLVMTFDGDENCSISEPEKAEYTISGTGKYVENGGEWATKKHDAIFIKYTLDNGIETHTFIDTLVMRDRAIGLETFTPFVKK